MKLFLLICTAFFTCCITQCSSTKPVEKPVVQKKEVKATVDVLEGWNNVKITVFFEDVSLYILEVYDMKGRKIVDLDRGTILADGEMIFYWDFDSKKLDKGMYVIKVVAENFDDKKTFFKKVQI